MQANKGRSNICGVFLHLISSLFLDRPSLNQMSAVVTLRRANKPVILKAPKVGGEQPDVQRDDDSREDCLFTR